MTGQPLVFRPHHFLCALGFRGKGYSDAFTANMSRIVADGLRSGSGEATEIAVTQVTDDICAPCPKRRGSLCTQQDKIARLDSAHAAALSLGAGDRLRWGDALTRMSELPDDVHDRICTDCEWRALGHCRDALLRLKSARSRPSSSF